MSDTWNLRGSVVRRFETHDGVSYYAGYVRIDQDHPWHGLSVNDLGNVPIRGGVTFAGRLRNLPAYPGWWVGFDFSTEARNRDPSATDPSLVAEELGRLKALRDIAEVEGWPLCSTRQEPHVGRITRIGDPFQRNNPSQRGPRAGKGRSRGRG